MYSSGRNVPLCEVCINGGYVPGGRYTPNPDLGRCIAVPPACPPTGAAVRCCVRVTAHLWHSHTVTVRLSSVPRHLCPFGPRTGSSPPLPRAAGPWEALLGPADRAAQRRLEHALRAVCLLDPGPRGAGAEVTSGNAGVAGETAVTTGQGEGESGHYEQEALRRAWEEGRLVAGPCARRGHVPRRIPPPPHCRLADLTRRFGAPAMLGYTRACGCVPVRSPVRRAPRHGRGGCSRHNPNTTASTQEEETVSAQLTLCM